MQTWINGRFHVMDGKIKDTLYISDRGYLLEKPDGTPSTVRDLQGANVYPAFIDCHLHLMGYGQHLSRGHVKGLTSKKDILTYIKAHLNHPVTYIEGYAPCGITKDDLDAISTTTRIYLRHEDYHGMTVNSKSLSIININSENGILLENDGNKALDSIEKNTHEGLVSFLKKAYETLYQYGVIGGHSDDLYYFNGYYKTLKAFEEASKTHPFYAHLLMHHKTIQDYEVYGNFLVGHPFIELGAVKMFYDGTTGSKTALMKHPYVSSGNGERVNNKETFISYVKKARALDLAVAVHVIGDLGLEEVSDILHTYPVKKGLKDRIIHASYGSSKAYEALQNLDVFLDLQPQFLTSDLPDVLSSFQVEPEGVFPFNTYDNKGLHYGLSSDAPVEIPNPILGMYAAIFRRVDGKIYHPQERLTRMKALLGYTTHAWQLTNQKGGYLKPGYQAHMVMTNKDILTTPQEDFLSIKVLETYLKGQLVYRHEKT